MLIRELLAIDALSEEVRADVITRAEGNPLYIEEFLRTLIETGRIEHRDGRWVAAALAICGLLAYWWNDRDAEERFYLAAVEAGRQGRRVRSVRRPLVWLARRAEQYRGDFARSAHYGWQAASLEAGTSLLARMIDARQASLGSFFRGDFAEAAGHAERAVGAAREMGAPNWIADGEWALGDALFMTGDVARAREVLEHGAEIMQRLQFRGQIPKLSARAARACLRLGDRAAARAHLAAAIAALLPTDIESHRSTRIAEAELAADGDPARAERILRDELARIEPSGYGFDIATLRLALGELLLAQGRGAEARVELAAARMFCHDPLARGWQERIDALLARAGAPVS